MPAAYGPTQLPDTSSYSHIVSVAIPFVSEREAVAALVPHYFEVPENPVVTVTHQQLCGVDYLAGRQYNVVAVTAGVVYRGPNETINAPVHLALWENDANSIVAGREFLGNPKLFAHIPDAVPHGTGVSFHCREYEGLLLSGRTFDMQPLEGERLQKAAAGVARTPTLGWKYIPAPGGGVDADYPVRVETELELAAMAIGQGEVTWGDPAWEAAPISARIIKRLRQLPIVEYKRAVTLSGPARLCRGAAARLPWVDQA